MAFLDKSGLTHFWGKVKAALAKKSDIGHTHSISNITNLQTTLNNKQNKITTWGDLKGE